MECTQSLVTEPSGVMAKAKECEFTFHWICHACFLYHLHLVVGLMLLVSMHIPSTNNQVILWIKHTASEITFPSNAKVLLLLDCICIRSKYFTKSVTCGNLQNVPFNMMGHISCVQGA